MKLQTKLGTSIIEVVIATALISVAIIAALSLTNQSQKQNTYAKNLAAAGKYATQASDWIRAQRDISGWATIYALDDGTYCLNSFPQDISLIEPGSCAGNSFLDATIYQRQVELTKSADSINLKITVKWMDNIERQATIEMELTSWY